MADQDRLKTMRAYQRFDPSDLPSAEVADLAEIGSAAVRTSATSATSATGLAAQGEWDPETTDLIRWFLGTEPPDKPFQLQQAVTIVRPAHYWEYLKADINAGPGRARGKMGTLQADLRRLHALFGGD